MPTPEMEEFASKVQSTLDRYERYVNSVDELIEHIKDPFFGLNHPKNMEPELLQYLEALNELRAAWPYHDVVESATAEDEVHAPTSVEPPSEVPTARYEEDIEEEDERVSDTGPPERAETVDVTDDDIVHTLPDSFRRTLQVLAEVPVGSMDLALREAVGYFTPIGHGLPEQNYAVEHIIGPLMRAFGISRVEIKPSTLDYRTGSVEEVAPADAEGHLSWLRSIAASHLWGFPRYALPARSLEEHPKSAK